MESHVEKVIIPNTDFADEVLGDLESISAGLNSDKGISLHSSVKEFITRNTRARKAQIDVTVADEYAPIIAGALYQHLKADGFDCHLMACRGFKAKLVDCSPFMEEAIREIGSKLICDDLIHFVVRCGNVVLDLSYLRLGSEYLKSNNTMFNMFRGFWRDLIVVDAKSSNNGNNFLNYAKNLVNQSNLKKLLDKDKEGDLEGNDIPMMSVTASAVVEAFGAAKRNRKTRVVGKTADGKLTKVRVF